VKRIGLVLQSVLHTGRLTAGQDITVFFQASCSPCKSLFCLGNSTREITEIYWHETCMSP